MYRCPYCNKATYTITEYRNHIDDMVKKEGDKGKHAEYKSSNMSFNEFTTRQFYSSNPRLGKCECGRDKPYNEPKGKFAQYCGNEDCASKIRERYRKNVIGVHGTDNLAALPEHQRKMMNGWERNKTYVASNGKKFTNLLSNMEVKILQHLDLVDKYDMNLVEAPAPFTVQYINHKHKESNHFIDIFLTDSETAISAKESVRNPNGMSGVKDKRRDNMMQFFAIRDNTDFNFFQIEGEEHIKDITRHLANIKKLKTGDRYVISPKIDMIAEFMGDKKGEILHKEKITHYANLAPINYHEVGQESINLLVTDHSSLYFSYDNTLYKLNNEKTELFRSMIKESRKFGYMSELGSLDKPIDIEEVNLREEYDGVQGDYFFKEVANRNFETKFTSLRAHARPNLYKEAAVEIQTPFLFKESRRVSNEDGEYSSYETLLEILSNI